MVSWRVVLEAFPSPARVRCRTVLQIGSPSPGGGLRIIIIQLRKQSANPIILDTRWEST